MRCQLFNSKPKEKNKFVDANQIYAIPFGAYIHNYD